jgi:hypothetical protein
MGIATSSHKRNIRLILVILTGINGMLTTSGGVLQLVYHTFSFAVPQMIVQNALEQPVPWYAWYVSKFPCLSNNNFLQIIWDQQTNQTS